MPQAYENPFDPPDPFSKGHAAEEDSSNSRLDHSMKKPLSSHRRGWYGFAVFFLFFFCFVMTAPLFVGVGASFLAARDLTSDLSQMKSHLAVLDIADVEVDADRLKTDVAGIRRGLGWTAWWRRAPWIGPRLLALDDAAQVGEQALGSVRLFLSAILSVQEASASVGLALADARIGLETQKTFSGLAKEEKRIILSRLQQALPSLREARDTLAIAQDAWNRIPRDALLAPIRQKLEPAVVRVFAWNDQLTQTIALLEIGLPLVGYPRPQTLLVLLQNADEMRPSGGFIGTVGLVRTEDGDLGHIQFDDVYALDRLVENQWKEDPPDPIKRHLGVRAWYLRDANWSPDVPQSATKVIDFFERERLLAGFATTTVDGVVFLEPRFFEELLHLTGPVIVDGKRFDEKNFFDELEYDVEQGFLSSGIPIRQRKAIVSKVGDALVEQLMRVPAAQWPELLAIITRALERKDVMIVMRDPSLLGLLDARHWTGRVESSPQDELMVVDANLAALKTDGVMDKRMTYRADFSDPSQPMATLTLTYRNTNKHFSWRYTRYRDYVRVYVPEGSELISSEGAMLNDRTKTGGRVVPGNVDVFHDLGKTVFGAFWAIEPGETRSLRLSYRLPTSIVRPDAYTLLVQRQPGSNTRLTLDLNFGKKLMMANPPEDSEEHGDSYYRIMLPLTRNRVFEVKTER